jgi:hypothetical protein
MGPTVDRQLLFYFSVSAQASVYSVSKVNSKKGVALFQELKSSTIKFPHINIRS